MNGALANGAADWNIWSANITLFEGENTIIVAATNTICGTTMKITAGIDPGYSTIGYSATTDMKELITGEVQLRYDIKRLLEKRASYRRTRRNRLWHREPRFNDIYPNIPNPDQADFNNKGRVDVGDAEKINFNLA